jgi:hypothetical protein
LRSSRSLPNFFGGDISISRGNRTHALAMMRLNFFLGRAMTKANDVTDCFDSAFAQNMRGQLPDPNKNLSSDYGMPQQQFQRILDLTSTCLDKRGWAYTPTPMSTDQTVTKVIQTIAQKTSPKPKKAAKKAAKKTAKSKTAAKRPPGKKPSSQKKTTR